MNLLSLGPVVAASFMASLVEFVEALTIVLAVGVVRGWRSALLGSAAAMALLLVLVALLGPALAQIPLPIVQLVVGTLLLLFGMRWLRKAVLRAAGVLPLHDEARAFAEETAALQRQPIGQRSTIDSVAFATAFKIVMLEGIEVVFIVIAIGAGGQMLPAAFGAGLALIAVIAMGLWLHRPLTRVPENTLKFGVGVLLTAFGTFWVGEGIGLEWLGQDWAILGLIALYFAVALMLVPLCRDLHAGKTLIAKAVSGDAPGVIGKVGRELASLFIDDGWMAATMVFWVAVIMVGARGVAVPAHVAAGLLAVGLSIALSGSAIRRSRERR